MSSESRSRCALNVRNNAPSKGLLLPKADMRRFTSRWPLSFSVMLTRILFDPNLHNCKAIALPARALRTLSGFSFRSALTTVPLADYTCSELMDQASHSATYPLLQRRGINLKQRSHKARCEDRKPRDLSRGSFLVTRIRTSRTVIVGCDP